MSAGAPEGIRTPDPQIRSLYHVIDIIDLGAKCRRRSIYNTLFSAARSDRQPLRNV
jgi:hypothetical protein